jgi:hypothetical protein
MIKEIDHETYRAEEGRAGACLLWFIWGITLSFTTVCSLALLTFLVASMTLNAYLAWQMSGYEVVVIRPGPAATESPLSRPAALVEVQTATPHVTETPLPEVAEALETGPTGTATPIPTISPLDSQVGTLSAIATTVAASAPESTPGSTLAPASLPTPIGTAATNEPSAAIPINPAGQTDEVQAESAVKSGEETTVDEAAAGSRTPVAAESEASSFTAPVTASTNSYSLIPIEGERESRPAAEHGDLNLKLREPTPIDVELTTVDVGAGVDPDAPKLSAIFEPNFKAAYTIHNWDWGCNCKGDLIQDGSVVLVGIATTPGQPVFIPPKKQDIYEGKYYATVLYASEDSLTFVYARAGTVVRGYTIHYLGLQTDPNLIAAFRESQGNQLPGLTLDTPVGVATDELIVAVRDNGKFLDARSVNDWWN